MSAIFFRVAVHEGDPPIRREHFGNQDPWIRVAEWIPQFSLRDLIRSLREEGYDDTGILVERE